MKSLRQSNSFYLLFKWASKVSKSPLFLNGLQKYVDHNWDTPGFKWAFRVIQYEKPSAQNKLRLRKKIRSESEAPILLERRRYLFYVHFWPISNSPKI